MKNNKFFTHKFLPIIGMFLFIVFIFTSTVFGFTGTDVNGNEFTCPDFPSNADISNGFVLKINNEYGNYLFTFNTPDTFFFVHENGVYFYGEIAVYSFKNNVFSYYETKESYSLDITPYAMVGVINQFTYFSNGLYNSSDKSQGFFLNPPQLVEEQVTIPAITQVEEIPQIMNKVLQMIIPVGLKILLVGLIIFLVRWVISRVT